MLYRVLALLLLFQAQDKAPREPDALLFKIVQGKWRVNRKTDSQGMRPVNAFAGMGLFEGEILRLDAGSRRGEIVVLYRGLKRISCPNQDREDCRDYLVQTPVQKTNSVLDRVLSLIEHAIPESHSVPGQTKSASLPDGFAEIQDTGLMIHMPGLPPDFRSRSYTLQFRCLGKDNVVEPPLQPNYTWQPGSVLTAWKVTPGFYRVNLLDTDAEPTGDYFLLLVYEAGKGGHLAADFSALVGATDAWGSEEQGDALLVRRLFLWQSARELGLQQAKGQ